MFLKKLSALAVSAALLTGIAVINPIAAEDSVSVRVTVANGTLCLSDETVKVTDIDGDGALTINDALYLAHEDFYSGGAAAGYSAALGDYGLYVTKLWGAADSSGFGYYLNNKIASGLCDPVENGDYIGAFAYTDKEMFSDTYCFFDINSAKAVVGNELTLKLSAATYDENWNPVEKPVEGAFILVNGIRTEYQTDSNGNVKIKLNTVGECIVSAESDTAVLVPPVCRVAVSAAVTTAAVTSAATEPSEQPQTGESTAPVYPLIAIIAICAALLIIPKRLNKGDE